MNFLINEGVVTYSEKVYIPGLQKDYEEIIHQSPYYNEYSYMSIFPNPTRQYFIIEYSVPEYYSKAFIDIIGQDGKYYKGISLKGKHNQEVVSTENLSNGIYFLNLRGDDQRLEVRKIIISK